MRVTGELGFSSLVLVVLWLVVPVIGFVIRRKWQHAVAREEEIKRLLILASEEAERVEQEATYEYGAVSVVKTNQCAVCYCPTTTRCAQCKAVHYCSRKCQIIHWRQGHKEECHPPSTKPWNDDTVGDFSQKAAEKNQYGIHDGNSKIEGAQSKISFKASLRTDICHPEVSCGKVDNVGVEPFVDGNIADTNSESSSNSFSGFSASAGSIESSDDASVCESIISNEFERLEGHVFVDAASDMPDTTSIDNSMGTTNSSSPKFASLLDSVNGFSTMHKLYQTRPIISKEESKLSSNGTSGLSVCKDATVEPCSVSSDFWDGTLNSRGVKGGSSNDTVQSHSNDYSSNKGSVSGSPCRFSYSTLSSQHAKNPKEKYSLSDDAILKSGGNSKSSAGSAFSENGGVDSSKARNLSTINNKGSNTMNYVAGGGSGQLESREDNFEHLSSHTHRYSSTGEDLKCAGSSSMIGFQSTGFKASNDVVDSPEVTSRLKSHALAGAQSGSRIDGHSHYSTKPGIIGVQSSIATLSQDALCSANPKNGFKSSVLKAVDQFRGSNVSKRFPLAAGSVIAGRYGDKLLQGLFPYDLFVKLYNSNKVELQPFGLINCGNSCYANAVLQCLAFTPPLSAYFVQGLHFKACAKKKCCFMCEFESLILKSKEGKSPLSPMGILSQLQNIGSQLGNGREEDAHEFLRHVVDTMQSVCLSGAGVNAPALEQETTLVGITFVGYLRSKIKCLKCGGKSERQERIMDLTVEIEGEIGTLEEALRRYTSTEILDGENKYHCVRCISYEKARKKLTISEAPNILTIVLKRFQSGKFGKLNKPIRFPEILDLAPFMSGTSDKSPIYRLYGVVVHLDILNAAFSGHYVCYVKNTQNKWFKVDDSIVTAVDLDEVLAKGAYMLLYARCSPRAPRLIRKIMVSPDKKGRALNGKTTALKPKNESTNLSAANHSSGSIFPTGSPTLDSFYSRFHHLKRILEEDSSSDNSSLISNNSDDNSWSTNSTHDSAVMDDLSDGIFGDSIRRYGTIWRNSDSETSSTSSSPKSSRHSPLADMDRYASGSPDATVFETHTHDKEVDGPLYRRSNGVSRPSDANAQLRKLDSSRSSSSNFGHTDSFHRLGFDHFDDINSGVSRRQSRERTD